MSFIPCNKVFLKVAMQCFLNEYMHPMKFEVQEVSLTDRRDLRGAPFEMRVIFNNKKEVK